MASKNSRVEPAVCTILLDKSFRILGFNEAARQHLALSDLKIGSELGRDRDLAVFLPDIQSGSRSKTARLFGREYLCRLQSSVVDGENLLELSVFEALSSHVEPGQVAPGQAASLGRAQATGPLDADFATVLGHELRNPLAAIQSGLDLWKIAEKSPEKARWVRETIERQTKLLSRIVDEFVDLASSGGPASELRKAVEHSIRRPNHYVEDPHKQALAGVSGRHKILVIDDNRALAEGLGFLLSQAGHDVRMAFDGKSALAMAADFQPDFVLLDIGLPDISGYEVAAGLRAESTGAPPRIVGLSGYALERHHQHPDRNMFDDYLLKPVSLRVVTSLLGQSDNDAVDGATEELGLLSDSGRAEKSLSCRVLVVEDNPDVAELTKELLEAHGYAVDLANTAEEAIELAKRTGPNVVLCDLNLGGRLTGWDVAQAIRASITPRPLMIAISAYSAEAFKAALKASAFDAQMQKPLDVERFEAMLADRHLVAG